jgi:hypothetical protein
VVERQEGDDETITEVEFENESKKSKAVLFRNRKAEFFDINGLLLLWAS